MFKDEEAENAHRASAGFARMLSQMGELIVAQPAVLRMEPLRMALQEGVLVEDWSF
jgi:quinol monooxygenase YgiN